MKILITTFLLCLIVSVNAQLTVSTGVLTPTQYVQNVLVGGGVTVTNVTFTGNPDQIGEFDGTNTTIGIGPGLILGSGNVNGAIGPNNNGSMSLPMGGYNSAGDPDVYDIINLGGGTTSSVDAAVLEFDFIPTGDTIQFNFVFGSEEYLEFAPPASSFGVNDAFGFFLSGPGIAGPYSNGAKNIALIPGTATPVTILNINPANNPANYIDNGNGNSAPFSTGNQYVQYDGLTNVMSAISEVQCGLTYHIKIAISDASDGSWDSGVFLQAGSFSSNNITLNSSVDIGGNDSVLYEGCGTAFLDFVRSDIADSAVYNYTVSGGTASNTDYTINVDSVLFLPGEDTVTLSFNAIQDGIPEPLETVIIQLIQTICSVTDTQTITFYISDFPEPILTTNDTTIACGSTDSVPVWVNVLGPPHTISWNTVPIQTTDTIWVNPVSTQEYIVTVSDTCGVYSVLDTAKVVVVPQVPINLTVSPDSTKYCIQDSIEIYAVTSGAPDFTYSWSPTGTTDTSFFVNPIVTTTYVVEVTDFCGTVVTDSVTITVPNFVPLTTSVTNVDDTICSGDLVVLDGVVAGGVDTYFSWNNGLGNVLSVNVNPITSTTYILTAMDSCGAIEKDTVVISINPTNFQLNLPDSIFLDCVDESVVLDPAITGGDGSEIYLWTTTGETSSTISVTPTDTTIYKLIVASSDGCSVMEDSTEVFTPKFLPVVVNVNTDLAITCPDDTVILVATVTGGSGSPLLINWSDGVNSFVGNNIAVNPNTTTTYTSWVNDVCAKDSGATDNFIVTVPNYSPLILAEFSEDTLICVGTEARLLVQPFGGEGTYNLNWSNGASSSFIQVYPKINTTYGLTVTDGCGNQIDTSVTVSVSSPNANFGFEFTDVTSVQFSDSSTGNIANYSWNFDNGVSTDQNPLHTFSYDGNHDVWLVVLNDYGCYDSIMQMVKPPLFIYLPNSFSPNGDGLNDEFLIKGVGVRAFEMSIFDRWGTLMFQTDNITNGWDGTYKGEKTPGGVYIYKVKAESFNNDKFKETGKLTIIR